MSQPFHAGGAAARPLFSLTNHSIHVIRDLFAENLDLDIGRVSSLLTIIGFASGIARRATSFLRSVPKWVQKFFTAAVTVSAKEELYDQVLEWIRVHVIEPQGVRMLTARVAKTKDGKPVVLPPPQQPGTLPSRRRAPIEYLPAFGTTWFFHERRLFAVVRSRSGSPGSTPFPPGGLPSSWDFSPGVLLSESRNKDEHISILCVGRSTEPIKRLFETCREFVDKQNESVVTVRGCRGPGPRWEIKARKPLRPLETVHLDDQVKAELVEDIRSYLNPQTQHYYIRRGIPYRRGYLLHGAPGTGKTSLSLALASIFALDLYVVEMPSIGNDAMLEQLFTALPPSCIVLLEDIDAVGMKREVDDGGAEDRAKKREELKQREAQLATGIFRAPMPGPAAGQGGTSLCTLSGLLNVLDGVASQEGRIVLMTSNFPDRLDAALLRPGRIDRKVHLGHIDRRGAEQMFRRMFEPDPPEDAPLVTASRDDRREARLSAAHGTDVDVASEAEGLEKAALEFAHRVPEHAVTPAQLQEYLLQRHESARRAVDEIAGWVAEQTGQDREEKAEEPVAV